MCEYFDEITLVDERICVVGEVVSFLLSDSINLELQGRILSIFQEEGEEEPMLEICALKRAIKQKKGDYVDAKNRIFNFYDSEEIYEIPSHLVLCPVFSLFVEKGVVSKGYFLEEVDAKDRKLMLYYSEYISQDGKITPAVTPELKMLWYHFNPLQIESGTEFSRRDSATGFLYVLKECIFDPFVSSLSQSKRRSDSSSWNCHSWKNLVLGAVSIVKGEKTWVWKPVEKELFIFEKIVIPFILVVLCEWFDEDRPRNKVYEAIQAIYKLQEQVEILENHFDTIEDKVETMDDKLDEKWYKDKEEERKRRRDGETVESEEEEDDLSCISSDKSEVTVEGSTTTEESSLEDESSTEDEDSFNSDFLDDDYSE